MLMTRAYHLDRGDTNRTQVLIPDSAHGTNPASASMAGFDVITLPSNSSGNTDMDALRAAVGENLAGSEVWLRVRDNGPGVDRELLAKMFSPFYTSKINGTGLGLAICKKLVDAPSGSIEVTSEPGDGAEFIVTFPKARNEEGVSP